MKEIMKIDLAKSFKLCEYNKNSILHTHALTLTQSRNATFAIEDAPPSSHDNILQKFSIFKNKKTTSNFLAICGNRILLSLTV